MIMSEFPLEKYLELENNPYLIGRIIIHQIKDHYNAEIDIIHKESHKIFKHVDILYQLQSLDEAIISGIQRLRNFLDQVEQDNQQKTRNNLH
jgi:hypothetical protein